MSCNYIQMTAIAQALANIGQPARSQIQRLMHFEGTGNPAAGSTLTDATGANNQTWGTSYNTQHKVSGNSSIRFSGSGSYIVFREASTEVFNTDDFTVEMWLRPEVMVSGTLPVIGFYTKSTTTTESDTSLSGSFTPEGKVLFGKNYGAAIVESQAGAVQPNVWTHIALTRKGNLVTLWINGKAAMSNTVANWSITDRGNSYLGFGINDRKISYMTGSIDEYRQVRGMAVYTGDFEPPTVQFAYPTA